MQWPTHSRCKGHAPWIHGGRTPVFALKPLISGLFRWGLWAAFSDARSYQGECILALQIKITPMSAT